MKLGKLRIILLIILIGIGVLVAALTVLDAPVSDDKTPVTITIKPQETGNEVISDLDKKKLIRSDLFAKIIMKIKSLDDFKPGSFEVNAAQKTTEILKVLNTAPTDYTVTFIEGYRAIDFAAVLQKQAGVNNKEFLDMLNNKGFIDQLKSKYSVLKDYKFNNKMYYKLEGLLAPDTYTFAVNSTPKQIIETLVAQTNKIYETNKAAFDKSKLSIKDVFTLASIVDAEAKTESDRIKVASIFLNRIKHNMPLGSDVTTYYGLQVDMGKRDLTQKELDEKNGYNTRANMKGLPVGPISNPNKESILAVLSAYKTDDLFFVSDKNGKIYSAKTEKEHNKIIQDLKDKGLWFTY